MTARQRGERYSDETWAEKEALAVRLLAENGATIQMVKDAIRDMPGTGETDEELHRSAILAGLAVGGPPPSDEALRPVAAIFGMVVASRPAAGQRRAS